MNIHMKRDPSLDPPSNYRHDAMPGDYDDDSLMLWDDSDPDYTRWATIFMLAVCAACLGIVGAVIWCVVDWVW